MNNRKSIFSKEEFIDRIFKGAEETRLLAKEGSIEILQQTIPEGKDFCFYSTEHQEGFEFLFLIDGKIRYTDPGPERLLVPGAFISRNDRTPEQWFRTESESTLLLFSTEPVFHLMQDEIEDFKEEAIKIENLEGMENHSHNLETLSVQVGRRFGLSSRQLYNLSYAAYFHDIGKARVPDGILQKEGELTDDEWEIMKKHTTWGREIIEEKDFLQDAAEIVEQTHEWVDGTGYPRGLEGNEISIEARIISVVDAYDAMITDRVYRDALTEEEAITELRENSGTQFDEEVVDVFLDLLLGKGEEEKSGEEVDFDMDRAHLQQRKYFLNLGEKVLSKANVDEILSDLAKAVIETSPFQRALISLYSHPVNPEDPRETNVIHFSSAGLTSEEEERVRELGKQEPKVNLAKFDENLKISNSYYIPHDVQLEENGGPDTTVSSNKSKEEMDDWHPDDKLYVPLTKGNRVMGHISVDDPIDGKVPTAEKLQLIEGLANLGSLAITKTQRIRELDEQKGKIRGLHSVGHSFIRADSLEELYRKTTELIAEYFDFEFCSILIEHNGELESVARESRFNGDIPFNEGEIIQIGRGITGWVAENREPVIANDAQKDARYLSGKEDIKSELAVPIESEEELLGVLDIQSEKRDNFSSEDLELLETLSTQLAIAISNISRKEELKEQATRDPLTGVYNRRHFSSVIEEEIERSHRYNHPLALMMIDINNFKEVNDRYSHVIGDRVLIEIATLLQNKIREVDTVVRYGGDEFLVLFPETGKEVRPVIQRIDQALEEWNEKNDLIDLELTIASGISFWFPDGGKDIEQAIKQADRRMYKDKGRI
ncbi:diguanylate cyclase [Candidatus Bipolaricaulota bacterium]|nr:diguanylate cyclase [Candidatus Bipolaricaulota bacterium]